MLAEIDLARLRQRMPNGVEGPATTVDGLPDPDRFTFTVRLRVTDDKGNVGEDRRVLALHHDNDLLPGYPLHLEADGTSSPTTADLDGDGAEDIVFGTSNGQVHALRANGEALPGWPVNSDPLEIHSDSRGYASGAVASPVFGAVTSPVAVGDLDGDGSPEIVATDAQGKGYVWQIDGSRRPGFPVATLPEYSHAWRSERDPDSAAGQVPDRLNRHNRDNRLGRALMGGASLGNLDGSADGSLEIVAGAFDRHLYAWRYDGTPLDGWPVLLKDPAKVESVDPITNEVTLRPDSGARMGTKILMPPSLGDIDGDGDLDAVAVVNEEYIETPNAVLDNPLLQIFAAAGVLDMGNTRVYAVHGDGVAHGGSGFQRGWNPAAFHDGWPVKTALLTTELLPVVGTGSNGPPALADVDRDGRLEVATASIVGPAYVFNADGTSYFGESADGLDLTVATEPLGAASNSVDTPTFAALGATVLAELTGSGQGFQLLSPVAGLGKLLDNQLPARQIPADNQLAAWQVSTVEGTAADGAFLAAFPRVVNDLQFLAGPAVADISGDGLPEALQGSGVYDLHAVDAQGREADGWPKFTGGWMVGSPAVGDVDGDGLLEVVAVTREGLLFVWQTSGDECGFIPWRRWHHDEWGTGNYHSDTRPPGFPAERRDVEPLSPTRARIDLSPVPGDDLFCGRAARFDVRFANDPITDVDAFAAAVPVADVTAPDRGGRTTGSILVEDARLSGRTVSLALVVSDEAQNRAPLVSLDMVTFPSEPTVTVAASPTATPAPTAATPPVVDTPTPVSTVGSQKDNDDGCNIMPATDTIFPWWMFPLLLLALRRRRVTAKPRR